MKSSMSRSDSVARQRRRSFLALPPPLLIFLCSTPGPSRCVETGPREQIALSATRSGFQAASPHTPNSPSPPRLPPISHTPCNCCQSGFLPVIQVRQEAARRRQCALIAESFVTRKKKCRSVAHLRALRVGRAHASRQGPLCCEVPAAGAAETFRRLTSAAARQRQVPTQSV